MKARKSLNFIEVDRKESQPQLGRINSSKSLKRSEIMLRIVTGDVKLMSGGPSAFTIYQQQFYHKNREEIFEFALSLTKPREIRL